MRLAFNASSLIGPLTGIGQYAYQLCLRFARRDDVELFMLYGTSWEREVRPRGHAQASRLRQLVRSVVPHVHDLAMARRQAAFTSGARSIGFDLYHEPNFLAYEFDGPLVLTVHDLSWIRYPETHPPERVRAMHKYFEPGLRRAKAILTVSEFVKKEVVQEFGIDPAIVRVTYSGLDPVFRPMPAEETQPVLAAHGLKRGEYLLSVGTLEPRKNLERTVQAYGRLPAALRARCPLVIAGGKGWRMEGIRAVLDPLVDRGEVKMLGFIPREDLAAVTAGAAAMVYPSIYEGFGLPPLEAMGCGVPAISSTVSSMPEVVGDTGLLVDPFDVAAITEAMRTLLEDEPLRTALGARALERSARFTFDACAQSTFAAYRDVLASSR